MNGLKAIDLAIDGEVNDDEEINDAYDLTTKKSFTDQ